MSSNYEDPAEELVIEYITNGLTSEAELAVICEAYSSTVRNIALGVINPVSSLIDLEDLQQCGQIGLIEALRKFDPARGTPFRAWAILKITGAMKNAILAASPITRSGNEYTTRSILRLDDIYAEEDGHSLDDIGLADSASPSLRKALLDLPARQAVILLLSVNGLPYAQIAHMVGASISTVNHDRAKALSSLRETLSEDLGELI